MAQRVPLPSHENECTFSFTSIIWMGTSRSSTRKSWNCVNCVFFVLLCRVTWQHRNVPSGCQCIWHLTTMNRFFSRMTLRSGKDIRRTTAGVSLSPSGHHHAAMFWPFGGKTTSRAPGTAMERCLSSGMPDSVASYTYSSSLGGDSFERPRRSRYLPSGDHDESHSSRSTTSCLNSRTLRALSPTVLRSHTTRLPCGRSLPWYPDHVHKKRSSCVNAAWCTPSCASRLSSVKSLPPHSSMPRLWKVTRYVPCGDQMASLSVQHLPPTFCRSPS
mmetsp:Transcript_28033/g.96945  ORF Transcript_28033/g.96945 Transcript_28033/m.96945 type:complete len:273 (-) Transcript_28033:621-1439(-)